MTIKKRIRCPCCDSLIEIEINDISISIMNKKVIVNHMEGKNANNKYRRNSNIEERRDTGIPEWKRWRERRTNKMKCLYMELVPEGFESRWAVFRLDEREDEARTLYAEDALDIESQKTTFKDLMNKYQGRQDVVFVRIWIKREEE